MWSDGNSARAASEDCYQVTGPAFDGQPYSKDISPTQVVGPHDGFNDNSIAIQDDRGNVQTMSSAYREYCFGMVSSLLLYPMA